MWVLSIRTSAGGPPAAASASNSSCHDALRRPAHEPVVERFPRPVRRPAHRSSDRPTSRHGTIPLITRRSSTRATPRTLFGKQRPKPLNCSSLNQNSLKSTLLLLQSLNHIRAAIGILFMGPDPGLGWPSHLAAKA